MITCSGYPLVSRMNLILSSSDGNLSGEQMARARWVNVRIKLVLRFRVFQLLSSTCQPEERRNFGRVQSPNCSTSSPSTSITRKVLCFESQTERFGGRLLRHACWCWRFSHAQGMSQCYQIPAIKQQYSDYQTRQRIRRGHFEQNRLHQKNELHAWRRNEISDTRPIKWKGQHFKDRSPDTTPPAAIAQRRLAPCKFVRSYSTDWLSAAPHVRPSQNTQKRCATPTHSVYDRFSATPAGQISLFSSRTCSHSLFEQLHTELFHLCWHHFEFIY